MKNFPVILKCQNTIQKNIVVLTIVGQINGKEFQTLEFGKIQVYKNSFIKKRAFISLISQQICCVISQKQYDLIVD
jgi:hypothetical protein